MLKNSKKIVIRFFVIALIANAIAPLYVPFIDSVAKKTEYKVLSKIMGEKVYICNGSYTKGGYLSSFERIDQEQHQKIKKHIDLASSIPVSSDSKYINDVYSAYIAAIHRGSIRPFSIISKLNTNQLYLKFSTAPPSIS
jgi:hypothetical protein